MFILAISSGEGFDQARWSRVLASGIDGLMLREKQLEARALFELVSRVQDLAPDLEIWVNGRLDVAMATGCGLHAPQGYPEAAPCLVRLSRPIHDAGQMPERMDAVQWILSPIFDVPGKGPAWGSEKLHRVLDAMPPYQGRVLALGGITRANAAQLRHPRLHGVALIRSLWSQADPETCVQQLRMTWN